CRSEQRGCPSRTPKYGEGGQRAMRDIFPLCVGGREAGRKGAKPGGGIDPSDPSLPPRAFLYENGGDTHTNPRDSEKEESPRHASIGDARSERRNSRNGGGRRKHETSFEADLS